MIILHLRWLPTRRKSAMLEFLYNLARAAAAPVGLSKPRERFSSQLGAGGAGALWQRGAQRGRANLYSAAVRRGKTQPERG